MFNVRCLLACVLSTAAFGLDVGGEWILSVQRQGDRVSADRLKLELSGTDVTGTFGRSSVRGTFAGNVLKLEFLDNRKETEITLTGKPEGDRLTGTAVSRDGLDWLWTAERPAARPAEPRTHDFVPTEFHRYFSAELKPALRIHPGDTVRTWSVDAGGNDATGKRRSRGGNPLSGPFYVEGALPGDTLVVRLLKVRTNRDSAQSGTGIITSALAPYYVGAQKRSAGVNGNWILDRAAGTAAPKTPSAALQKFRVPIEPMVGCIAVAPPGLESIRTSDSGNFGGNMDYNRIREGASVYLPVSHPGALLLIGDGHAAQGDGELTGDALETSMDLEFTVDILRGHSMGMPFAEDSEYWMAIGIAGSLDLAMRRATTGMAQYLEAEHDLAADEAALVMGFAVRYDIADLVGTQVSVVAKLPKSALAQLPPKKQR